MATTSLPNSGTDALNLTGIGDLIASGGDMSSILDTIDKASTSVLSSRVDIGSTTNALASTIDNLSTSYEDAVSAESGITGTDMAQASTQFSADSVKSQFATALFAQSNSLNQQNALTLLRT